MAEVEVEDREPEFIRDPTGSWSVGIIIAVLIVLTFWWAARHNTPNDQPWSSPAGTSAPS
jgi:hypothetical protein